MTTTSEDAVPARPVEIFLTKTNIEVTGAVYREDETGRSLDVDSVSMRGAQREITAWMISRNYEPAGRWACETEEGDSGEESRRTFRPRAGAEPL